MTTKKRHIPFLIVLGLLGIRAERDTPRGIARLSRSKDGDLDPYPATTSRLQTLRLVVRSKTGRWPPEGATEDDMRVVAGISEPPCDTCPIRSLCPVRRKPDVQAEDADDEPTLSPSRAPGRGWGWH